MLNNPAMANLRIFESGSSPLAVSRASAVAFAD
jgi:hypothetical protein